MKHILFVDDEPNILSGLRRVFHPQRNEWDMTFVESAASALAILEVQPVDVLVTDMKMPGRTGADLLQITHERFPHIMRIVLSGYADFEDHLRSVFISHRFLMKPYDAETLQQVVTRSAQLGATLKDESLRQTIGSIDQIPVLPAVYRELTVAMARDENIGEIANIVLKDQGLSLNIIRFVNSGLFGLRQGITDLHHALAHIGLKSLSNLALTLKVFSLFDERPFEGGFSLEQEQEHSARTAQLASQILTVVERPEDVYLAAMLHNVGRMILATKLRSRFERAMEERVEQGITLSEAEEREFGVTHAELGAYVLDLWGLPHRIVEAVAFHEKPGILKGRPEFDISAAIHIANALNLELTSLDPADSALDEAWLEAIGVTDRMEEWRGLASSLRDSETVSDS